jgi:hypothetical protein
MCTHLVVNHRVAVHVPALICRLRPAGANNSKIGAVAGSGITVGKCYDLGFADHRHVEALSGRQPDFGVVPNDPTSQRDDDGKQ